MSRIGTKVIKDMKTSLTKEIHNGFWKSSGKVEDIINPSNIYKILKSTIVTIGMTGVALLDQHLLSVLIALPMIGAALLLFFPRGADDAIRKVTLLVTIAEFLLSLVVVARFDVATAGMQLVERAPWIPQYGISYIVGVDGISLWILMLTTFIMPITILSTWSAVTKNVKEFMVFMLVLETAMVGVFLATDLFLFYIFWELVLIPMYFLIGVWGGERRIYAAIKFFLYTFAGSVLMLVAIIALYFHHHAVTGVYTMDLMKLYELTIPVKLQLWLFAAFFLAFSFKVPMFPFHTWLPDAHVEAPTAGSVILAGVLLKMGTYGFLRFAMALFPVAATDWTPLIAVLAVAATLTIGVAVGLAVMGSPEAWALYNGLVSYLIAGSIFLGERLVREWVLRRSAGIPG